MLTTNHPIEKWYSGKGLHTIRTYVLPTLATAEKDGYWPKGASRKIKAALNKQNVAIKFAKDNDRNFERTDDDAGLLDDVLDIRGKRYYEAKVKGSTLVHWMNYGQYAHAESALDLCDKLLPYTVNAAEKKALATARQWAEDFAPIAELDRLLDSRRAKPEYVCKTLSPTVLANVGKALQIDLTSVAVPPMKGKWIKVNRPIKGQPGKFEEIQIYHIEILWPEGTKHCTSKFSHGSRAGNSQCEACGHAIRNGYNWVPLLATTPKGPVSLWVGRDCASKLFGCDVTGDAEYARITAEHAR